MVNQTAYEYSRVSESSRANELIVLAWGPGAKIMYQMPGNRNFNFIDPHSGKETPFVSNDSVGWMFSPRYSPDGTKIAINCEPD